MTTALPRIIAIVPAAGIGSRATAATGSAVGDAATATTAANVAALPKQYRLLKGVPMLRWAVQALLADARIDQVRVVVAPQDPWVGTVLCGLPRTVWRPCGGPSRAETVLAALQDLAPQRGDWVLVHDAARPGLPPLALARLIDHCLESGGGGLLAMPVADTIKRAHRSAVHDGPPVVQASVLRDDLWLAQTPQMFPAQDLLGALQAALVDHANITDEASAMELAGESPALVPGSVRNFKVTWPEDFGLMEHWLEES